MELLGDESKKGASAEASAWPMKPAAPVIRICRGGSEGSIITNRIRHPVCDCALLIDHPAQHLNPYSLRNRTLGSERGDTTSLIDGRTRVTPRGSSLIRVSQTVDVGISIAVSFQCSMYDTVCTLPFAASITALAVHQTQPIFAVGLVSGHVGARRLPPIEPKSRNEGNHKGRRGSDGTGTIESIWKTRRHKGSCRSICFSHDGRKIISAGTDGIVKGADVETGRVEWKLRTPTKG